MDWLILVYERLIMSRIKYLLVLCFVGTIYGAQPQKDGTEIESIQAPLYGLNTSDPSFRLNPKFSPYMRNVFIDNGSIEGVNGYTVLGSSMVLSKISGIFPFIKETGQTTFLVTDSSRTLETADFNSWTFVSSGSNTGSPLNWMQVRNKMWGFNGIDFVKVWDGNTLTILDGDPANLPNVPKFKYGAYWQERVWGFNVPGLASDVYFSALSSTDAVIIAPDDWRAWPLTNFRKIGAGNGELGTSLWVKDGQLQLGKERSKYTMFGTGESSYFPRQDESNSVGVVSDDSVVNLDGYTYSLGKNGIYRDDIRISDAIEPDILSIVKTNANTISNLWESQGDFNRGTFQGTTATVSGLVQMPLSPHTSVLTDNPRLSYNGILVPPANEFPATYPKTLNAGSTFYGPIRLVFYEPGGSGVLDIKDSERVYLKRLPLYSSILEGGGASCANITIKIFNGHTGISQTVTHPDPKNFVDINFPLQEPVFDGWQINQSSFHFKIEYTNTGSCANDVTVNNFSADVFEFQPATTGQYLSDVATNTSVTAWGSFNSVNNTNGGSISYYLRSSTSIVNISTQTWKTIVPGAVIGEPIINRFIQWGATVTSVSSFTSVTNIDNVQIDHVEGSGAFDRAFGIDYKNRYWLATTTVPGSNMSLIYVKSRITNENPDAWMPIEGVNILCFARDGDNLYAGAVSTGIVYRMDYGTNFGGTAIRYIYETPDMTFSDAFYSKDIISYRLDAMRATGLYLDVNTSIDMGSYSNKSISLNGTGRGLTIIKGVTNPAKTLKIRLTHAMLDKAFGINEFAVRYKMSATEEPK